ncbi:MAG: DUF1259 domain-containing protein [Ginsengibacter sp.]
MKKTMILVFASLTFIFCNGQQLDSSALNNVFGKKGMLAGNVYKITFPRTDLKVKVGNFSVVPGLALGSWAGITGMGDHAMMMGDLVLLDTEVPRVEKRLLEENLEITAIHNHLINESPNVKYVHYEGTGDPVKLAKEIKAVLEVTRTPLAAATPKKQIQHIDWSKVTSVLGKTGKQNGVLLQYGFPRNEKITVDGMEMPAAMGVGTGINFQMDGNRAATTGDFVLLANEVNPVIKALTANGITVTAVHNHILQDEPRLFMMHFWGVGDPGKLAKGLKDALNETNSKK